jgi:hypothetical protein
MMASLIHHQDAISPLSGMQAAVLPSLAPPPRGRDLLPAAYHLYASVVAPRRLASDICLVARHPPKSTFGISHGEIGWWI